MDLSKLKEAEQSEKLELYQSLIQGIYDLQKEKGSEMDKKDLDILLEEISKDLLTENQPLVVTLLKQLGLLLGSNETEKCFLSDNQKKAVLKSIINVLKVNNEEQVVLLCFDRLDTLLSMVKTAGDLVIELINQISEITHKKSFSTPVYIAACNYIQKFFIEYKDKLADIMHIVPKLVFSPLSHSDENVRNVADKTLDDFPKLLLYAENEAASCVLLKLVKDTYCKELLVLFKDKQEAYVLKVWKHIVNALGKTLHCNLPSMTPLFQLIERGFKSPSDEVCTLAFVSWKSLISNFALDEDVLNDSKKLRFLLKPFKNLSRFNENISSQVCDTWWHLAWSLSHNLSSRFTEVCIPLLEFTIGKTSTGQIEKAVSKATQLFLAKRGCHFLLRLLEQPPSNAAFSRITSPKKLPSMLYPSLQIQLDVKVIIRHSKEIMLMIRSVIETFGHSKEMTSHIESLLKSMLFIISSVIDDRSKESTDAVISLLNLVCEITESRMCTPLTCLKCIDSLSKLPKSILVSPCFSCGPRKPQDILCTTLLKLLLNPYLFAMETPNKKFLMAYNRLIQAGLGESLNPLLMTQKYIHIVKSAVLPENTESEILYEIWSGIASPLLESIEKTQEVNQGDKQDHDFSCLYDVLLCPFEHNFPVPTHQFRTKPAFRLWTNLYRSFIRSSSLVTTVLPNETCEQFCARLKTIFTEDLLKEPQHFEVMCFILEVIIDTVDFASAAATNSQGFASGSLLLKRKKPLGNLTSLVDLLALILKLFYSNYIDIDEDIYHSCTPKAQKKGHITKTGVPFDLIKLFLSNLKSGSIIPFVLGEIVPPISKLFSVNQKKCTNAMGTKLEELWNVVTSTIEMHYMGPYDSDFLDVLNPLLEICITHPRRLVKERSRRFWFATFAPSSSALKMPESFKNALKKSKLSLAPEDNISSIEEMSFTQESASLENGTVNFETVVSFKEPFSKPFAPLSPKKTKTPESKTIKSSNTSTKKSVDELPISEFVMIDTPGPSSLTPRRRSIRHRKSFVPALYNDLSQSQDTTTLGGSSESFDTSSSCEIIEFQSQEVCADKNSTSVERKVDLENDQVVITIDSQNNQEKPLKTTNQDNVNLGLTHVVKGVNASQNGCNTSSQILAVDKTPVIASTHMFNVVQNKSASEMVVEQVNGKIEVNKEEMATFSGIQNNHKLATKSQDDVTGLSESDVKESVEKIVSHVSASEEAKPVIQEAVVKRSNRVQQKKRSADESENMTSKNAKRIDVSIDSFKTINTELDNGKVDSKNSNSLSKNNLFPEKDSDLDSHSSNKAASKPSIRRTPGRVLKKHISESFSFENEELDKSVVFKPNQTCPEIIDLSDSDEIIPSSQSSSESVNYKKSETPEAVHKKSRRSLKFDTFDGKAGTSETFSSITIHNKGTAPKELIPLNVEKANDTKGFETSKEETGVTKKSTDISKEIFQKVSQSENVNYKKSKTPEVVQQSHKLKTFDKKAKTAETIASITMGDKETALKELIPVSVEETDDTKDLKISEEVTGFTKESTDISKEASATNSKITEPMPLKSSENLLNSEDLINAEVKSTLSTVLQINEKNNLNVAENTPPFCEDICVLQSAEHVNFQSNIQVSEAAVDKVTSKFDDTDVKLHSLELGPSNNALKDESPKTVRAKSLRSGGKGSSRKSLDSSVTKKTIKRTKRKSMPCASETKKSKSNILESISEAFPSTNDVEMNIVDLKPNEDSCPPSSSNSESIADSQEKILNLDQPSQSVENEKTEMSLLIDVNNVITDIHEKLESYEESNTMDFGEVAVKKMKEDNFIPVANKEPECKQSTETIKSALQKMACVFSEVPVGGIEPITEIEKEDIELNSTINEQKIEVPVDTGFLPNNDEVKEVGPSPDVLASFDKDSSLNLNYLASLESNEKQPDECNTTLQENKHDSKSSDAPNNTELNLIEEDSIKISADKCSNIDSNHLNMSQNILKEENEEQEGNSLHENFNQITEIENEEQETAEPLKTFISLGPFEKQDVIICSNDFNSCFEEQDNELENCVGEIAAYEEIVDNSINASQESNKNLDVVQHSQQAIQNTEAKENPTDTTNMKHDKTEVVLNIKESKEVEGSQPLMLKSVEGTSSVLQNSQVIKENGECDYDINDLLLMSSGSDFTENLVEISDLSSEPQIQIMDNVTADQSTKMNDNLCDDLHTDGSLNVVDEVQETPCLLTSEILETDSDNKSDDQNASESSENFSVGNISKKRKAKVPVRSPFTFRHRSSILIARSKRAENCEPIPMLLNDCKTTKRVLENVQNKSPGNGPKKQKTVSKPTTINLSNNSAGTSEAVEADGKLTTSNKYFNKSTEPVKSIKAVNYDEMTNLNTRLNASMTFQTRRYKMIVASQKTGLGEPSQSFGDEKSACLDEENSTKKSTGILKRRKSMSDLPSLKIRKVTFSEPLFEERLFKSSDILGKKCLKHDFLVITKGGQNNLSEDTENISKIDSSHGSITEELPFNECETSENIADYSNLPVSPLLINCEESVSSILKGLASPAWIRALETVLLTKNIKTIGDLCKLNVYELKGLPFKSPKVASLHDALVTHLLETQKSTLEKLKSVEDWFPNEASSSGTKTKGKGADQCEVKEGAPKNIQPEVVQSLAEELLKDDNLKTLSTDSLVLLAKKCFAEVTDRLQNS